MTGGLNKTLVYRLQHEETSQIMIDGKNCNSEQNMSPNNHNLIGYGYMK